MARRLHFYDDQDLLTRESLNLVPGPVTKLGPVQWPDAGPQPFRRAAFCGTVLPWEGGWRLYHSRVTPPGVRPYRLALAESADGMNWSLVSTGAEETIQPVGLPVDTNLVQPQAVCLPDGTVRLYFWYHGHEVGRARYLAAESTNGIDFRIVNLDDPCLLHPSDLNVGQQGFAAGLMESVPRADYADQVTLDWWEAKRRRTNDATFVYYDEAQGRFVTYSVWLVPNDPGSQRYIPHDNAPQILRVIQRRESDDGLFWGDPELIIIPDEHDPLDIQFYHLAVQPLGEWRVGSLGHYRCWAQTMDLELCFSRDGRHWRRPLRGPFIPRGQAEDTDYWFAYPTNSWLDQGTDWLMLYDGGNYQHNGQLPAGVTERREAIMAARVPKGRLAGLQSPGNTTGSLEFKIIPGVEAITVDADVAGSLRAELRDIFGRPLAGYHLDDCLPVTGDRPDHVLRWQGDLTTAPYRYDAVRVRLEVTRGTLYGVTA